MVLYCNAMATSNNWSPKELMLGKEFTTNATIPCDTLALGAAES